MKISVITPSVRKNMLPMVRQCLNRQTFDEWEWIVCSPFRYTEAEWIPDPPKAEDELYSLNKAFNALFKTARGELVVSVVDGIWFPPDTLQRLWWHFENNSRSIITTVGHQYKTEINGKPEELVWQDPRARSDHGSFYEVAPSEMELCVASLPKQALLDCGGMDEVYDKGAAIGEKEMCWRLDRLGYKFFIDQSIEYRALHHERLSKDWDEWYKKSSALFVAHMAEIEQGTRKLNVGFV